MKGRFVLYGWLYVALFFIGCKNGNETKQVKSDQITAATSLALSDTFALKESFNVDDTLPNDYYRDSLKPVQQNFKRINSITHWTSVVQKELEQSTEGGEAMYYYLDGELLKMVTRHYGETFQLLTEYYIVNNQPSFVFERTLAYNRPIYYDTAAMKENKDTVAFDISKSSITENRNYFLRGKLVHQVSNEDCGTPFTDKYLQEEQARIHKAFNELVTMAKSQ